MEGDICEGHGWLKESWSSSLKLVIVRKQFVVAAEVGDPAKARMTLDFRFLENDECERQKSCSFTSYNRLSAGTRKGLIAPHGK